MKRFLLRLLLIGFPFLLGTLFIVTAIKNHSLGKQSENWPTVNGKLVSESSSIRKKKRFYIFYEYDINGVHYKNSRVNFQDDKASKKDIRDKYTIGDSLTVRYNPDSPEQSILIPGASMASLIIKIVGGLFCYLLSFVFLMKRKS